MKTQTLTFGGSLLILFMQPINNRIIALVDCNSFYVSCERLFRPDLKRKPVVVLSNNDGCIISRSTEAKQVGVKMGEPYFNLIMNCTEICRDE